MQKCKLSDVLVSSPGTTAHLSPVAPLPDVHEAPNDVLSASLSSFLKVEEGIRSLLDVDS